MLPLYEEIARLHRRVEQLQQEQNHLLHRFAELTAGTAAVERVGAG
jgi:hypothetical protein